MVQVEISLEETQITLFSNTKMIDITISVDKEIPSEAVQEAFETLELVLERRLELIKK